MTSSDKILPKYEQVPIEDWGPEEFEECRSLAIRGRPEGTDEQRRWLRAKMHLVWAYRSGYGTEPDSQRHFEILVQLAELDSEAELGAKWLLAQAYKEGIGTLPDEHLYFEWMERAAKDGDPEAMFSLAEAYRSGDGLEPNEDKYFYWRRKMAEEGSPFALMDLAHAFRTGTGTAQSNDQFFKNATAAVEQAKNAFSDRDKDENFTSQDLPRAFQLLAQAYREGIGTDKNEETYFKCLSDAVTAANTAIDLEERKEPSRADEVRSSLASITFELALAYLEGFGTRKNSQRAAQYMRDAAVAGDVSAMLRLAALLESGTGTRKDLTEAFHWRKKAAERNDPDAMYETAIAYGTCKGVEEDASEFQRWARSAVRAGHNKAFIALNLAELHTKGQVTPRKTSNVLRLFDGLRHEVQQIKLDHSLSEGEASDGVAHFTTLETLHSMLPSVDASPSIVKRGPFNFLRLYNLSYVNDPQEGKILLLGDDEEARTIQDYFPSSLPAPHSSDERGFSEAVPLSGLAFSVYVGSFTLRSDRLDLWRAYGRDGTGFCIVTPIRSFRQSVGTHDQAFAGLAGSEADNTDISLALYKVEYEKDKIHSSRRRLNQHLGEIAKARARLMSAMRHTEAKEAIRSQFELTVRATLSDVLYLYKHGEYRSEGEVRMLAPFAISARAVCADERTPARLYVRTRPFLFTPGSKIIIGPKVSNKEAVRLELKHRLDRNNHSGVEVIPSDIQYR